MSRQNRASSGPPKSRSRPYDNRPRSGPKRAEGRKSGEDRIAVQLPDEPPRLDPGAARALLRIVIKAHARLATRDGTGGAT